MPSTLRKLPHCIGENEILRDTTDKSAPDSRALEERMARQTTRERLDAIKSYSPLYLRESFFLPRYTSPRDIISASRSRETGCHFTRNYSMSSITRVQKTTNYPIIFRLKNNAIVAVHRRVPYARHASQNILSALSEIYQCQEVNFGYY